MSGHNGALFIPGGKNAFHDSISRLLPPVIAVMVLASLLAGCAASWSTTTYDPRWACQSFGGSYWEHDGTCHAGSQ